MSTDFSIKPIGTAAAPAPIKPISPAVNAAVTTELPASQSVTATDTSSSLRNDTQSSSDLSSQVFVDRGASSIVYQVVNDLTGYVVSQFPDDATLRRRAYFHALDVMKTEQSDQPKIVREA
jgi:hypothetical protein